MSDVRILPESKQGNAQYPQTNTDIYYDNQPEGDHTQAHAPSHQTVDLDDGLMDEDLNSMPYTNDIQYNQTDKTPNNHDYDANSDISKEPHHVDPDSKAAGDAKTPLPKPKKPPKLPN